MKNLLSELVLTFCLFLTNAATGASQPNFVWIVSEDNSVHYQELFFRGGAKTPNIAKLAEEGLLFTHAFSNAAVCSAARTTLATGVFGPRIATHYHRNLEKVNLLPTKK